MKIYRAISLLFTLITFTVSAQDSVQLTIREGLSGSIKTTIEKNSSLLLTEINNSFTQNSSGLNLTGISITEDAKKSLADLWSNVRFRCDDSEVVETCLVTSKGYQIRQIPLIIEAQDDEIIDEPYQEAVISFDKEGVITSFYFTIGLNLYSIVRKSNKGVTDVRRRMQILDYVEHFRTAYNQKDIEFLDMVFSDDALIITGTVVRVSKDVSPLGMSVKYNKRSKQEYISNLKRSFIRNKYINVKFDEIEVLLHPTNKDFYGVKLHQLYSSSTYSDDGYLFLLWDFRDEDNPKIHVRTWQPKFTDSSKTFIATTKEEVFSFADFDIEL